MIEHTTRAFDSDLQELAKKILYMGRSDDEQIANAIEALLKRDAALARSRALLCQGRGLLGSAQILNRLEPATAFCRGQFQQGAKYCLRVENCECLARV